MPTQSLKLKKTRRRKNPEIKLKNGTVYTCSELMELTGWDKKVILNRIYLFRAGRMTETSLFKPYKKHRKKRLNNIKQLRLSLKDIEMTPDQIALQEKYYPLNETPNMFLDYDYE